MNEDTRWLIESITTKLEITIKRLWILCILLLLSLIISNACWIWYESQWKYVDNNKSVETLNPLLLTLRQILSELYNTCNSDNERALMAEFIVLSQSII